MLSGISLAPRTGALLPVLLLCLLTACAVSTPFWTHDHAGDWRGGDVVVSVTHIVLKNDSQARARFWEAERLVDSSLRGQPGLIGYTKRLEVFGDEAWTMSVWADPESVNAFMRSAAHRTAMARAQDSYVDARFVRASIPGHRFPLPWDEVLTLLERSGRHYWE